MVAACIFNGHRGFSLQQNPLLEMGFEGMTIV
jgi:hypothetical protein